MQATAPEAADKLDEMRRLYEAKARAAVARDGGPPARRAFWNQQVALFDQRIRALRATLPKPRIVVSNDA